MDICFTFPPIELERLALELLGEFLKELKLLSGDIIECCGFMKPEASRC